MEYSKDFLNYAHKHSALHRDTILKSNLCGCFYCLEIFSPMEVIEWIDENNQEIGQTALCPKCDIDSVLGSDSGLPIEDKEFLREMNKYWF